MLAVERHGVIFLPPATDRPIEADILSLKVSTFKLAGEIF
jgi:hypothetical protein